MTLAPLIITLSNFTYGGEAMGRHPDGRAVFVPFGIPGETVRLHVIEEKRGYIRANIEEIITVSSLRIQPRCIHFQTCGGCHYQHLAYHAQLEAKENILRDQLIRIGKLPDPPVHLTVPTSIPFNYRNHIQFHLDPMGKPGFLEARSERVVAIQECHLPEDLLNEIWPMLDFDASPEMDRIGLRLGVNEDIQLIMESHDLELPEFKIEELPISAVHLNENNAIVLAGNEAVVMEVNDRFFRVSAGSFFQVNTAMAEKLVRGLLDGISRYTRLTKASTILDVYCGVGLFSAFLAPLVGRIIGIESSPSAVEDFTVNLDEFDQVEIYEAPAEEVLPELELTNPQVIVVDPPRSGIDRTAMDAILAMKPALLVYISCDPSTLGRDARRLTQAGYQLREITPYDLFPQTFHIESLSFWSP